MQTQKLRHRETALWPVSHSKEEAEHRFELGSAYLQHVLEPLHRDSCHLRPLRGQQQSQDKNLSVPMEGGPPWDSGDEAVIDS